MITFIGLKNRSAGLVRGVQVSELIQDSNFFDHSVVGSNLDKIHKHVIIVRNRPNKSLENHLKRNGHIVGYDIIDSASGEFYFRKNPVDYNNHVDDSVYDYYIVNNTYTKNLVEKCTSKKVFVIPHHHVNFLQNRTYFGESEIKTAGYLGLPEQLTNKEEIEKIFNSHGIDFKTFNPKTRQGCIEFLSQIQVGITYMKNQYYDVFSKAKPNSKIVNYQSFGIVTLCDMFESYVEFGSEGYLIHENIEDFKKNIQQIVENKSVRKNISDISFNNSKSFNIENIINKFYTGEILDYFKDRRMDG